MTREEFVAMVRRENPQLAAVVDAVKEAFPGARVSFLSHLGTSIGTPMGGIDIFPSIDPALVREIEQELRAKAAARRRSEQAATVD